MYAAITGFLVEWRHNEATWSLSRVIASSALLSSSDRQPLSWARTQRSLHARATALSAWWYLRGVVPVRLSTDGVFLLKTDAKPASTSWQKDVRSRSTQLHLAAAFARVAFSAPTRGPHCRHRCFPSSGSCCNRPSGPHCTATYRGFVAFLGWRCSTSELRRHRITLSGRRAHRLAKERPPLCCNGRCSQRGLVRPTNHLCTQVMEALDNLKGYPGLRVAIHSLPLSRTLTTSRPADQEVNYRSPTTTRPRVQWHRRRFCIYYEGCDLLARRAAAFTPGTTIAQRRHSGYAFARSWTPSTTRCLPTALLARHNHRLWRGHLIGSACRLHEGEIQDRRYLRGAKAFVPDVGFILDIGLART